jgi:dihydrodipicolinate synthase/N-acetylneuraminate lyase
LIRATRERDLFATLNTLLDALPKELPLGLYECPAPYRRLLTDDEFSWCANSGRFVVLKDVSCDLPTVERRVKLAQGTPLNVINANAAIAWPAILAGSQGSAVCSLTSIQSCIAGCGITAKRSAHLPTNWRFSSRWAP